MSDTGRRASRWRSRVVERAVHLGEGILAAATMVAFLGDARSAVAEECPIPPRADARLAKLSPAARVAFVMRTLDDQAARARTWSVGWAIAGTAVAAGNYVVAGVTSDKDARTDAIVSGSASLLIPITALAVRLRVEGDAPQLRALVDATDGGRVASCLAVERAEEILARDAEDERWNAGWFAQTVAIAANGTLALILGVGFGHWSAAAVDGIGGLVLSEAQIFTQPTGAVRAWERYRAGDIGAHATATGLSVSIVASTLAAPSFPTPSLGGAGSAAGTRTIGVSIRF